jgi:hypothetical protein
MISELELALVEEYDIGVDFAFVGVGGYFCSTHGFLVR